MALHFPNVSRSYDPDGHRVRFWGHDNALEVAFFLEESAIFKLAPKTLSGEPGILSAFDAARDRIQQAAAKAYSPSQSRRFYVLAAADF